jgi:hypothetical protein
LKWDHGSEDLLLVFDNEHACLKHALHRRGDFISCQLVGTLQHPDSFDDRDNAGETNSDLISKDGPPGSFRDYCSPLSFFNRSLALSFFGSRCSDFS